MLGMKTVKRVTKRQRGMQVAPSNRLFVSNLAWFVAILLFLLPIVSAQSLNVATRLSPWPPLGWPAGAKGEVRLVAPAAADPKAGDIGVHFEIGPAGEVTYRLPDQLPSQAEQFYKPLDISDLIFCDEAYPTVSPPDVEVVVLQLGLFADGELWGLIEMSDMQQPGLFTVTVEQLAGLYYARAPVRIGGSGVCTEQDFASITYDLNLQAGRNLVVARAEGSLDGTDMTLTTSETLELPGAPVGYQGD